MLPVGWLVAAVLLAILLSMWVTFTLTRLDRLHARVDAARAALDAQLVRRAAALQRSTPPGPPEQRQAEENAVGRGVAELVAVLAPDDPAVAELVEAAERVRVARRFYNDAVRDTRGLRSRRMPRVLHLAGRVPLPEFFDIDDTVPSPATRARGAGAEPQSPLRDDRPDPGVAAGEQTSGRSHSEPPAPPVTQ